MSGAFMATPIARSRPANIRKLGGARPAMARAAPTLADVKDSGKQIHSSLMSFMSSGSKKHNELSDLPKDFESIPWLSCYHAEEEYSTATGLIIGGPWSPSNLDSWGKMWCFTILHWIGKSSAGSKPKVTRRTVDKSSTWYSDHGRQIRKQYPDDLMVNSLRTKKPINSRFFSMMEITLRCQEPALVALCKIKIKAGTKAPASSGRMVAAEQQEVDTAATSMEIGLHQEDDVASQHGTNIEANMDLAIIASNTNEGQASQHRTNVEANMDPPIITSNTNEDLASQHGANVEANMDPAIIASDTNEGRIHPEEFRGQYSLDVLGVSWEDLDDLPPSLLDDDWGDLLDQPPSFLDGCGDILDQPPFLLDDDLGDLLGQPPSFLDDE